MTKPTRRTLLKSAAAAPFAANMGCHHGKKQFSVILHGMVGVQIIDNGLLILVPEVGGHTYGYGSFRSEEGMMRKMHYKLIGVDQDDNKSKLSPGDSDAVISLKNVGNPTVVPDNAYCTFQLPFPKCLQRLRPVLRKDSPFFVTGNASIAAPDPKQLPLSYGFVYTWSKHAPQWAEYGDQSPPSNTPPKKMPNQHIWAAPSFRMPTSHGHDAMTAFDCLFNQALPFDVTTHPHEIPPPKEIPGEIADDEVKSIAEQRSTGYPTSGATRGREYMFNDNVQNCWAIFITD